MSEDKPPTQDEIDRAEEKISNELKLDAFKTSAAAIEILDQDAQMNVISALYELFRPYAIPVIPKQRKSP